MRTAFVFLVAAGIAAGGAAYYIQYNNHVKKKCFRTAPIQRGDLTPTIGATGTLEPEDLIDVGSQITGKILNFGPDLDHPGKTVDFCSDVRKDMLLANIDPTYYQAQVDQAKAALMKAEAELKQLKAICEQAKNEWERAKELQPMKAIAGTDFDAAAADFLVAQANIAVGEASVQQAKAALAMAKINLDYTVIKSPVDGVVIARRVNVGQTVAASLNTPSMFLIAKDLRRMQVWVSVNEADIGRIRLDMPVRFTVDAFPNDTFRGTVTQIRMNATMTQNVVTYTVVVTTDNPDLKLYPYMTANVLFEVEQRRDVFMAPNAALQWEPKKSQIAAAVHKEAPSDSSRKDGAVESSAGEQVSEDVLPPVSSDGEANASTQRIWLADGDFVRPLDVVVGITDDINTEISGDDVNEGMRVVIGERQAEKGEEEDGSDETSNPFLPKIPKGRRPPPPPG